MTVLNAAFSVVASAPDKSAAVRDLPGFQVPSAPGSSRTRNGRSV
jgi:hypothetical protein